jgi:hypothetical protein
VSHQDPIGTWFRNLEKAEPDQAQRDGGCSSPPIRFSSLTFLDMSQARLRDQDLRL